MHIKNGNGDGHCLAPGDNGQSTFPDGGEKTPGRIGTPEIESLLERQNYRCALTGYLLTPETASLDHKVPMSRGGAHTIGNMQVVLTSVNHAKGTMAQDEFIQLCREVVAWTGQRNSVT